MTIRKNMILTYLLASVIPLFLSTVTFTLLFRVYWQQNVENILVSELNEFKNKIDTEAEKVRFYSFSIAETLNINKSSDWKNLSQAH